MMIRSWTGCALAFAAVGCTGEEIAGEGTVEIVASGGEAMRLGFPHQEGDLFDHRFIDNWEIDFDSFVLSLDAVRLNEQVGEASGEGPLVAVLDSPRVMDLMRPESGVMFGTLGPVPATRHDFGFDLVAPTDASENISATDSDFEFMRQEGYTFLMRGTARRDTETITFEIGFRSPTRFRRCSNGIDMTRGIAVEADKTVGVFIYPHIVHVWWDVLLAGDANLRFDPWAAVAGLDNHLTADDLANQNLLDLRDADGQPLTDPDGSRVRFDDGGVLQSDQLDLLSYVEYAFRQSLHFNGLGFCPWDPL